MRHLGHLGSILAAGLVLLSACTGGAPSTAAFHPSFRAATCPGDVDTLLVVTHSCGYLTVLEDRSRQGGPTIRLFVLKIPPPVPPRPDPVLIVGDDLGAAPDYGGHQPTAQRVDRVVYQLDARGTGHSQPSLSCPEVDQLKGQGLSVPTGDPGLRQRFLTAVGACRARLARDGVDPSEFGVEQMAADIEDLRAALGIGSWNLASYGSASRAVLEAMRESPQHIRAVWMDSPQFPQLDEPTEVPTGTALAFQTLVDACRADPVCDRDHPNLQNDWASAVDRLDSHPVSARAPNGQDVLVDAGAFVRSVAALLEGHGMGPGPIVSAIAAAAHGTVAALASKLATGGALCSGYLTACTGAFSVGAYLSVLCRDEAPFVDTAALQQADGQLPGLGLAFANNPYLAACPAWDVRPAGRSVHDPVTVGVPTLILSGQFDPFAPPGSVKGLSGSLPTSFFVEVPGASHNALGYSDCPISIRNAWIDDPSAPPSDTGCLAQLKPVLVG